MKEKIGFIGLGNMGLPMAKNLIKAGYNLQVYNRRAVKAEELDQTKIIVCQTPAEAAANVQFVISMLSEDAVLEEAVLGENGLIKSIKKDAVHISMSTVSPETSIRLDELHRQNSSHYLTAPVFGRPEAAAAQKLFVCVSGKTSVKEASKPILEAMSQGIFDFGEEAGKANVVKIAGNFMIMASMEMMAEAFTLGEKNGIDPQQMADFFGSTLFNAPIYQNYGKLIAEKSYEQVGFKAKLGYKDARLAMALSQKSEMPMPLAAAVHNRLLTAVAKGWGDCDWAEGFGRGVTDDAGI
ncbi:NAD(P)-dependent oxidoreductase [Mucilaginibacter sp.]|uniref:NAD(P)-dependent oxidoreductase n=1 Tax=Mucilaginibacter sp. TaxID=1882438 RepID=UPI003AFF6A13